MVGLTPLGGSTGKNMKKLSTVISEINQTFTFFTERKEMEYTVLEQENGKWTVLIQIPLMNEYKKKLMIGDIRDHLKEESFRYQVKKLHDQIIIRLR
jgi:hypothetical protein